MFDKDSSLTLFLTLERKGEGEFGEGKIYLHEEEMQSGHLWSHKRVR